MANDVQQQQQFDPSAGYSPAPTTPAPAQAVAFDPNAAYSPSGSAPPPAQNTGVAAGAKRNTVDTLTGLWHAFNQPATDDEKAALLQKVRDANAKGDTVPEELATNPSRATLALHRLIDAPADELLKKGRDEVGVAQDLISNHKYWRGGNLYLSGLADKALSGIPLIGPVVGSIASRGEGALVPAINKQGEDVPVSDVPEERKDLTGAATDVAALVAAEHAPAIAKAGGEVAGKAVEAVSDTAGKVANKINAAELRPEQLRKPVEPPKPVAQHVSVETPLDDATLRKSFDKTLSSDARDALREKVGGTIPAGSSVENTLMKAIRPTNETIQQQGLALNKLLQDAGPLKTSAGEKIGSAIENLKNDLPGGTEETFGKAIDKELARAKDVMQSTNPTEVNGYIRELDKRIDSYQSPEEPIDSPSGAADAARVTIRRILRDKINTEVPGTKPINDVLGKNLELRNALRKKFGDVAYDPVAAESQHFSELRKGNEYLNYEQQLAKYDRTMSVIGTALKPALVGVLGYEGWKTIRHIFGE